MARKKKKDLIQLTGPANLRSIKRQDVKDGTVRVYWGKLQPISYEDTDDYTPPTIWPHNWELLYRPIAIRIMGVGLEDSEVQYFLDTYTYSFFANQEAQPVFLRGSADLVVIPNYEELGTIPDHPSMQIGFNFGQEFADGFQSEYGINDGFSNSNDVGFINTIFFEYIDFINANGGDFHPSEESFTPILTAEHHYKVINGVRVEI